MSRPTSFVLGYHGCERKTGIDLISHATELRTSKSAYHWLGTGIYFWEDDPQRAAEWATGRAGPRRLKEPFVVGAILDLRHCLDLRVRANVELVRNAYELLASETVAAEMEMPRNVEAPRDPSPDKVMRYLDFAVVDRLHKMMEDDGKQPFDTVRGLFPEGDELYDGSGFKTKTHCEIAIRDPDCIVGYFLPRNFEQPNTVGES